MGDVIHAFAGIQRAVQGFPRSRGKCRQAEGVCRGEETGAKSIPSTRASCDALKALRAYRSPWLLTLQKPEKSYVRPS